LGTPMSDIYVRCRTCCDRAHQRSRCNFGLHREERGLPWVEAGISVGNRPGIIIMIPCRRHNEETKVRPMFRSLELVRQSQFAEWPHLHDLPTAMRKARSES
jgi:hypothetical protein